MLWRNMAAMATEEMLRANPIDGIVLLGGCVETIRVRRVQGCLRPQGLGQAGAYDHRRLSQSL
jgi:hypothetical protein